MCDKAILENGGTLESVPDYYTNQEMCNKVVDNYPYALEFVPECYRTEKMCDKTVNNYPSTIEFVPESFMTQEMCDKAVNRCFFVFGSIPNRTEQKEEYSCNLCITRNKELQFIDKSRTQDYIKCHIQHEES